MRWMVAADTDRTSATRDYFHSGMSCQLISWLIDWLFGSKYSEDSARHNIPEDGDFSLSVLSDQKSKT